VPLIQYYYVTKGIYIYRRFYLFTYLLKHCSSQWRSSTADGEVLFLEWKPD